MSKFNTEHIEVSTGGGKIKTYKFGYFNFLQKFENTFIF